MKSKIFETKKKRLKIIAIFVVLLLIVGYACREELRELEWEKHEANAISDAKEWYEKNKPETMGLRSTKGDFIPMKAEWTNAFSTQYENWEVVETNLISQERLLYLDKSCNEMYEATNDPKYAQCYTRLVFRTDRKTNSTVGFLMTVVPDLNWLEKSKFKPFRDVTYLFRSKHFGGMILFHELDGQYSNGWLYDDGYIAATVGTMEANPNTSLFRSQVCDFISIPYYRTECTIAGPITEDGPTSTSCKTVLAGYNYSMTCYDNGNNPPPNGNQPPPTPPPGGGGYTGGGSGSGGTGTGNTGTTQVVPGTILASLIKNIKLDANGIAALNEAFSELMKNPTYSKLYTWMMQNGVKFESVSIDPSSTAGGYDPKTGNLIFQSANVMMGSLPEEYLHLIQDNLYGGIAKYTEYPPYEGRINIEFEAKLIQDLECGLHGGIGALGCGYIGGDSNQYFNWLKNITNQWTTFPSMSDVMSNKYGNNNNPTYFDFVLAFSSYNSYYNYPIKVGLTPLLINMIYSKKFY